MKIIYVGDLRTECTHPSGVKYTMDAPGKGELFSPTDLFAMSFGSCMLTVMAIEAKKLSLELKGMSAEVEKEMSLQGPRRIVKMIVRIRCPLLPNAPAREKLEQAARDCPVHHSLNPNIRVEVDFIWGL